MSIAGAFERQSVPGTAAYWPLMRSWMMQQAKAKDDTVVAWSLFKKKSKSRYR